MKLRKESKKIIGIYILLSLFYLILLGLINMNDNKFIGIMGLITIGAVFYIEYIDKEKGEGKRKKKQNTK